MNLCSKCNKEINTNESICDECKIKIKLQNAEDVICSCCNNKVSNIKDVCPICGSSLLGSKSISQIENEKKYYKEHAEEISNEEAKNKSDFFSLIGIITFAIPFLIIFLSIGSFTSTTSGTGIEAIGGIFIGLFLLLIFMPISIICRIISHSYMKQTKK